jgi:hypothetical protein
MRISGSFKLLFCLAFLGLALGCDQGRTPTEPIDSSTAQVAAAEGGAEPVVIERGDDGSVEGRRAIGRLGVTPGVERPTPAAQGAARTAPPATPAVAVAEARGGNGNGHGNGNGGGNGNGNGGGNGNGNGGAGGRRGKLELSLRPDTWNTNWEHAEGNLQAFVRGKDATKINPPSVELTSEGGDTVTPRSVRINGGAGGQLVATFSKSEAFESLDDPKSGDRVEVTLRFTVGDATEATELTDEVRIVGPDDDEEGEEEEEEEDLELKISPDDWNMNWQRSNGQVHAFLRGSDAELDKVDLESIRLIGDDATAEPVEPLDVRRVGHQIVARFSKRAAFDSLDDPDPGETHTVKIKFLSETTETELSEEVKILGR